jgi:hypothetical protein
VQRVLVEAKDPNAIPSLKLLAKRGKTPLTRIHALWTLEGMGALDPDIVSMFEGQGWKEFAPPQFG